MLLFAQYTALLSVALIWSSGTMAQSNYYTEDPKIFVGGLIAGANFTQVDGDTYYGYHKIGLNAGGVVYVHFTEILGASMEIIYTQKGSRGETVTESPYIGTYVTKYFMNLNYVEVPVTFQLTYHNISFEAGASFARLINSKEWLLSDQPVMIDPIANRFNTTDLNYIFGASRKIYKHLYADARFQYSIVSIRPVDRVPFGYGYGSQGQFNNLLTFRLEYLF